MVTEQVERWHAVPRGAGLTVLLAAFVELWDAHRQGYDVTAVGLRYEKPVGRARTTRPVRSLPRTTEGG